EWRASKAHNGYVGRLAALVGRVDGHAGNRKLVGIDAAASGTVERHVGKSRNRSGSCRSVCRYPNISPGRCARFVGPEAVRCGINHLRAIRAHGAPGGQRTNYVDFCARAGSGTQRIEIKTQRCKCTAQSRSGGPRLGGTFTALSLNFDTLGTGTCAGTEVNVVRALAAGGPMGANGSQVIYATTDGLGPNESSAPTGGNVWVTTNAAAASGTVSTFANVTLNGPGGGSINPNQFPISSVTIDPSDKSGKTAYVTVMGFTGPPLGAPGPGHVWQTINAGATWTDFTGIGGASPLQDAPVNAVVVDSIASMVYVGTDMGVFESPTPAAADYHG